MNKVKSIVIDALLIAILIVLKEALSFIPNIEVVTLLLIIFSMTMKLEDLSIIVFSFATIQNLLYGFNIYSVSYYFAWFIIVFVTYYLKNILTDEYRVAFISLIFGLLFDIPFSIPYFLSGFSAGIAYLLSGLVFSLVHGIGNFIIALILYRPLYKSFKYFVDSGL